MIAKFLLFRFMYRTVFKVLWKILPASEFYGPPISDDTFVSIIILKICNY